MKKIFIFFVISCHCETSLELPCSQVPSRPSPSQKKACNAIYSPSIDWDLKFLLRCTKFVTLQSVRKRETLFCEIVSRLWHRNCSWIHLWWHYLQSDIYTEGVVQSHLRLRRVHCEQSTGMWPPFIPRGYPLNPLLLVPLAQEHPRKTGLFLFFIFFSVSYREQAVAVALKTPRQL